MLNRKVFGCEYLEMRDLAIVELMYSSGLRVSEAANINLEDFEEEMSFLRVLGKGSKTRLVPIGRYAKAAIENWILERSKYSDKSSALFINLKGSRLTVRSIQLRLIQTLIDVKEFIFVASQLLPVLPMHQGIQRSPDLVRFVAISRTDVL